MSKRGKGTRKVKAPRPARPAAPAAASLDQRIASEPTRRGRTAWLRSAAAAVALVAAGIGAWRLAADRQPPEPSPTVETPSIAAEYLGTAACAQCHAQEHAAWQGSQHGRAMQVANEETVFGDFTGAKFTHGGLTSVFFRRAGRFYVNTDGPDGTSADFEVKFTFGVEARSTSLGQGRRPTGIASKVAKASSSR